MKNEIISKVEDAKMTEEGYNGYTNYETWLICLNINNDEGLHEEMQQLAAENNKTLGNYEIGQLIEKHLAERFWLEPCQVIKICDSWTIRDWKEINWTEVAETRLEE